MSPYLTSKIDENVGDISDALWPQRSILTKIFCGCVPWACTDLMMILSFSLNATWKSFLLIFQKREYHHVNSNEF